MREGKRCNHCGNYLPLEEFAWSNKKAGLKSKRCRKCQSKLSKNYNSSISDDKRRENRDRQRIVIEINRQYVKDYLNTHPCVDCGESDPIVLEFDHVRGEKKYNISYLKQKAIKLSTLMREIDKCEVRCANCHRKKTNSLGECIGK